MMKKLLLLICLATLVFSCKKNKQNDLSITTELYGAISGTIGTTGIFTAINVTDNAGRQFSATVDPVTGAFKFNNLATGKYLLSLPASSLFYPLINLNIEVLGGKTTDTGVIQLNTINTANSDVSGYFLPVGSGTDVTATEQATGKVYTVVPNSIGFFLLNLPDGDYTISFNTKPPMEAPQELKITIAGKALSLGSINCKEGSSGSLTGILSPVYGASSVKATNMVTGSFVLGVINYTSGFFNFPVMSPGTYQISLTTTPPYLVPVASNAVVTTGKATDLGTITLPYDNNIRVLTYKTNGKTTTQYNQVCNFNGDALNFTALQISFSSGIPENQKMIKSTFTLAAANIIGPGKYTLTGSDNSNITLFEVTAPPYDQTKNTVKWSISSTAPVGQLEVSAIDRAARTIRGTFSAILVADKSTIANKSVTEGSFYLSY